MFPQGGRRREKIYLRTGLTNRERNGRAPRGDGARYLFENLDRAVGTDVCLQPLRVMPDAEFVGVRLELALGLRLSWLGGHDAFPSMAPLQLRYCPCCAAQSRREKALPGGLGSPRAVGAYRKAREGAGSRD